MKKTAVVALLIMLTLNTSAQLFTVFGHDVGFIYVGPKVGMNFSKFSEWSYSNYTVKNRLGYQLGVVGEFGFTKRFSFQTELMLYSKGTKGEIAASTETKRMNSIAIPLLAKYSFSLLGLKKVYAVGGTYSTVRIGSGKVIYDDGMSYTDDHWTRADWGFSFGCGAEYPTNEGIWGLDLRYDLGMVDVYQQANENVKSRFRSFSFAVTYKFDMVDMFLKWQNKRKAARQDEDNREIDSNRAKGLKIEQRN